MALEEFPPWQSVHPRRTVFVGCMVASSVEVWQEMQPVDFLSASSWDSPRKEAFSCRARVRGFELAYRAKRKDNAEKLRRPRLRREEAAAWMNGGMVCV